MSSTVITLRRDDACAVCATALPAGSRAAWDRSARSMTCLGCVAAQPERPDAPPPSRVEGTAGASAEREHDRRHRRREARIERRFRRVAGLVKLLSDDPQSIRAWKQGAAGERKLAQRLSGLVGEETMLRFDRRIPGGRGANIDAIAVAPSGVWVIDAKDYRGRIQRRDRGGLLRSDPRLYVGRRDQTKLVDGMARQLEAVTTLVGDPAVPIHAVLCFVDGDWGWWFPRPFECGGVLVTWAARLAQRIDAPGPLGAADVAAVSARLDAGLPPA